MGVQFGIFNWELGMDVNQEFSIINQELGMGVQFRRLNWEWGQKTATLVFLLKDCNITAEDFYGDGY